jgi:Cdc6-like AAA superfamily ATPase
MARRTALSDADVSAKRFEANQIFTPSAPVAIAELFAGRQKQLTQIIDAIGERGRHAILYGETGVGKSSLAQIIPFLLPSGTETVRHVRIQAFPGDTFSDVARRVFHNIHFTADYGEGKRNYNVSEFYPNDVTIDDFLSEMSVFRENELPIIVIDEFNEIDDEQTSALISKIVKALSDSVSKVTIIIVGVANNVGDLIKGHQSIERCVEEIPMPRMPMNERREVLDRRLSRLGMNISGDARWKILNLSKGLPAYVHTLGKFAVFSALQDRRVVIAEQDVDSAINDGLQSSQQSLRDTYENAVHSNNTKAQFRHVLTACALARGDDAGFFMPAAVREPLSSILKRSVHIANFQDTLKDFAETRGPILERVGEPRSYRFRFLKPSMQPYVIMRGIRDNVIDETAKRALSSPEQPELPFSSD